MRGVRRLAIITSTDGSGQDAEKALLAAVDAPENKGVIQIVANEHFNTSDVSVTAQIENIKAAKPQLLFAWSTGAPIATVFRAVQQAGLEVPVATTDGNMTYAQMTRFADFLPKQLYIHSSPWMVDGNPAIKLPLAVTSKQKEFYGAFRAAGIEPDVATVLGWEPANIIASALQKLGPDTSAQQINDYLQHLQGFAGVAGIYDFVKTPQRGLDIDNAIVTRWNPDKKRWLPVSQLGGVPLGK
jgi:branched-chain amino acid transport system substrate-binding protein